MRHVHQERGLHSLLPSWPGLSLWCPASGKNFYGTLFPLGLSLGDQVWDRGASSDPQLSPFPSTCERSGDGWAHTPVLPGTAQPRWSARSTGCMTKAWLETSRAAFFVSLVPGVGDVSTCACVPEGAQFCPYQSMLLTGFR